MNILVTSSRMPFALDEIRKLGRGGHRIFAVDTFEAAPGSHSRWAAGHFVVTPPEHDGAAFVAEIDELARRLEARLIVPCFEEVFWLARHRDQLWPQAELFAPDIDVLVQLHDKARFHRLARQLGIPSPTTEVVRSHDELDRALHHRPRWIARPAFSRGGIEIAANAGPLAGEVDPATCTPTAERPWIVQDFVDGIDVCSFGVARHGHLVACCSYVHPKEMEHSGGIVFESIVDDEALGHMRRIVEHFGYHGHISLDFRRSRRGLVVIECNPRPTAGVHLMPGWMLRQALFSRGNGVVLVAPAGVRRRYSAALVRDAVRHPRELRSDLAYLLADGNDVYDEPGDRLPALYSVLSYGHVLMSRLRRHGGERPGTQLMAAYFDGIQWNGQPLE